MVLGINTNLFSINAQRNLAKAQFRLGKSFRRLSSGQRLRSDDSAGFAIADRLKAQVRSLSQASRNIQDGISATQIAEGSLNESSSILIRLRELAVQASNGTLSSSDRASLQSEFSALRSGLDQIANSTSFNGLNLLDGSLSSIDLQVGSGTSLDDVFSVGLSSAQAASLGLTSLSISNDPASAIDALDLAINSVASIRGSFGAAQSSLESRLNFVAIQSENLEAARSRITDLDYAKETAELTKNQILLQASLSILAQSNLQPQALLGLIEGARLR